MKLLLSEKNVAKILSRPEYYRCMEGSEVKQWWEVKVEYLYNEGREITTLVFYTEEDVNQVKEGYVFYN